MPGRIVSDDERRESEIFHLEQDIARWLNYKIQVLLDINKEKDETLRTQLEIRAKELESIYFKVLDDHSVCCATKVSRTLWEYLNNEIPRLQQKISDRYTQLCLALSQYSCCTEGCWKTAVCCLRLVCGCPEGSGDHSIEEIFHQLLTLDYHHSDDLEENGRAEELLLNRIRQF